MAIPVKLREDEEFVISALAREFSASWRPGEDPPDAYLRIGNSEIAVEISTLTQHVTDDRGTRSRLADDRLAIKLAKELNAALQELVPWGHSIGLILSAPILNYRKTKAALEKFLRSNLADGRSFLTDTPVEFHGNAITIYRNSHGVGHYQKIGGAISHRTASADLLGNARYILEDRMSVKATKCAPLAGNGPIWLALLNDYWLTDGHTYRYALSEISAPHPFEKILLVNGDGSVEPIFDPSVPALGAIGLS